MITGPGLARTSQRDNRVVIIGHLVATLARNNRCLTVSVGYRGIGRRS